MLRISRGDGIYYEEAADNTVSLTGSDFDSSIFHFPAVLSDLCQFFSVGWTGTKDICRI